MNQPKISLFSSAPITNFVGSPFPIIILVQSLTRRDHASLAQHPFADVRLLPLSCSTPLSFILNCLYFIARTMKKTDSRGSPAIMLRSPRILFLALLIFGALTLFWTRPYNYIPAINPTTSTDSAASEQPTVALPRGRAPAGSSSDAKNDTLGVSLPTPPTGTWVVIC